MSSLDARNFVKRNGGLYPADRFADEFLSEIPANREVLVTVRRPRNPRQHALLFALLRKVTENTDRWPSEEALLDDLKLATEVLRVAPQELFDEVMAMVERSRA